MVQYSLTNSAKICHQSEKDGTILKQNQNLSPVRKRWYNTQTEPKPVTSQKKMVQYSNSAKTCHQSEKRWYNTQTVPKPVTSQKKMVQYSNRTKTCHQSEKDATVLKQSKTSHCQKKMVQYSNRTKTCHQSEKDGTILKQCQNLSPVRKRWYNTQTEPKPVTSQKEMVQFLNSQNTLTELCSQTGQNLLPVRRPNNTQTEQKVRKRWYNTQTVPKEPKPATSQKNMVQYSNTAKTCQQKKMLQYSNRVKPVTDRKRWYNT